MNDLSTLLARPYKVETGFCDSTPILTDDSTLRTRAGEDGYLFFRSFLPAEPLLELRRQILGIVQRHGWLRAGTDPMEGICDLDAVAKSDASDKTLNAFGVTADAYRDVQKLELFHSLPHHPKLLALFESLFQATVLPHPRHITRVLLPAPSFAPTPPPPGLHLHPRHPPVLDVLVPAR